MLDTYNDHNYNSNSPTNDYGKPWLEEEFEEDNDLEDYELI